MNKLKNVRSSLQRQQIDGLLITNPINRRYVTGFTGTAGVVLITQEEALLITDFRYIEQATEQAKHFTIVQHKAQIIDEVNKQVERLQLKNIGFEANHLTFADYRNYADMLKVELVPTKEIIETIRLYKTEEEIAIIKKAANIADLAFDHILNFIKVGVKEIDIANELEFFMRKQGASSSSFDIIVASGIRSSLPHGTASEKEIQNGELVTLDFGAIYDGYCSDITRTVAVGEVSDQLKEIYDIVLEAQLRGVRGIKPNMTTREADALTRDYITEKGYGEYFGHSTGHGIGLDIHEGPALSPNFDTVLKENMVVTVEPGIYLPNIGGCRIEDDIVLTATGNERLTKSPKEFIQL